MFDETRRTSLFGIRDKNNKKTNEIIETYNREIRSILDKDKRDFVCKDIELYNLFKKYNIKCILDYMKIKDFAKFENGIIKFQKLYKIYIYL